jgi:hypothetical protein
LRTSDAALELFEPLSAELYKDHIRVCAAPFVAHLALRAAYAAFYANARFPVF